jgi:hypothetical protein
MVTGTSGGLSGYAVGGSGGTEANAPSKKSKVDYLSLEKLKRQYQDYLGSKRDEIDEQQDARRFRHGSQWTSEQLEVHKKRKQPVVTVNKISRKIHGVIGVLARLKQDPKAFPRTPDHEAGAELATAVIRFVMDSNKWDTIDYYCGEMAAIDGIGGVELNLTEGDHDDPDIEIVAFNTDSFFYDPRSYRPDFSDARYMGVGKWLDIEEAVELFPDHEEELRGSMESGTDLTSDPDREFHWYHTENKQQRIRVVEHWYRKAGEWYWSIYTGDIILEEGESYLKDEKGNSEAKYIPWSAYIDQDGDRYGFVRDLKPLQTELNMRRGKALYTMLGRRIKAEKGAFDNIETARREASRVDGVVEYNKGYEMEFDDQMRLAETNAQFQFYEATRTEIESFGPNVAITTGEGLEKASGRAIHLLQQAGLADLGPFLQSYRGWKIRLYRAVWNAVQRHWTTERWIRVTDDERLADFIKINGWELDPMTGFPVPINKLGALDVDIILDEGPDTVNQMADAYDTLEVLAQRGAEIPPEVLIELAPLPLSLKQRLIKKLDPEPSPEKKKAMQLELAEKEADVRDTGAATELKQAQAYKAMVEANAPPEAPDMNFEQENPMMVQAEVQEKQASADAKRAQAEATRAKIGTDQMVAFGKIQSDRQKMQMDMQSNQQKQQIERDTADANIRNTQAQTQATNQQTQMRPYEVRQEQYQQGLDYQLKRDQAKAKTAVPPKGRK